LLRKRHLERVVGLFDEGLLDDAIALPSDGTFELGSPRSQFSKPKCLFRSKARRYPELERITPVRELHGRSYCCFAVELSDGRNFYSSQRVVALGSGK